MSLRLFAAASLTLALLFTSCATQQGMAGLENADSVSKSTIPVYLLTVTLKNNSVAAYQPKLVAVKLEKHTGPESSKIILIEADQLSKNESLSPAVGNSYLLRMAIAPGDYTILGLTSVGQSMFTCGDFFTPLKMHLAPSAPGVYYLGHIDATVRERKEGEFRAGGNLLPTQEQRIIGAFGGTFDVEISDQWETDAAKFQTKFPALNGISIQKTILPPFSRSQIQQWWDNSGFQ
jgi:hypothetical protein